MIANGGEKMTEFIGIAEKGLTAVIVALFLYHYKKTNEDLDALRKEQRDQYYKQQKRNEEREEKLYAVIDTLAKQFPELQSLVVATNQKVDKIEVQLKYLNGGKHGE